MLPDKLSVLEVIEHCPGWGVPHFQRGLVWDDGSISLLLESLYFDTPLGSIVLWECDDPAHGIAWCEDRSFNHLIVDGQQRIRSLYQVFMGSSHQAQAGKNRRVWCVNVRRTEEFRSHFERRPKEGPLFVNVLERDLLDHAAEGSSEEPVRPFSRFQRNFVRLDWLLKGQIDDIQGRINVDNLDAVALRERTSRLVSHILLMGKRELFVRVEPEQSLSKIVGIYNRINSAGKRVEGEEKAFAALVAVDPDTSKDINGLFRQLHPDAPIKGMERDHSLRRQKERRFGFKLFMRTFAQVCAYHFGSQSGMEAFSFDFFQSSTFSSKAQKADFRYLWGVAGKAISFLHKVVTEDLRCDDLRFLPETTSLIPAFQLLIRYPGLMDVESLEYPAARQKIAALCLHLMLAEFSQVKIVSLVRIANDVRWKNADEAIQKMMGHDLGRGLNHQSLSDRLHGSNSLQDRYMLMLYWLERRHEARDFSYSNNENQLANPSAFVGRKETLIDSSASAEKQHLVPYASLKRLYADLQERGSRAGTHKANNIGNLTYISGKLNGFEGVGENPLTLAGESADNLHAHFLDCDGIQAKSRESYETFCKSRREAIAGGFLKWMEELRGKVLAQPVHRQPIKPLAPQYLEMAHMADEIRKFEFDDEVESLLVDISCCCKRGPKRKQQNDAELRLVKKGLLAITAHPQKISIRPDSDELVDKLRTAIPSAALRKGAEIVLQMPYLTALTLLRDACLRHTV